MCSQVGLMCLFPVVTTCEEYVYNRLTTARTRVLFVYMQSVQLSYMYTVLLVGCADVGMSVL